jgi:hypothetical protein
MNEDDPDRRVQFCERFQHKVHEDQEFVDKIVWFNEAAFKLNGAVNRHDCVYWAPENPHIHADEASNLPGLVVCTSTGFEHPFICSKASKGMSHTTLNKLNKMAHHHNTTETSEASEATSARPYQVNG